MTTKKTPVSSTPKLISRARYVIDVDYSMWTTELFIDSEDRLVIDQSDGAVRMCLPVNAIGLMDRGAPAASGTVR